MLFSCFSLVLSVHTSHTYRKSMWLDGSEAAALLTQSSRSNSERSELLTEINKVLIRSTCTYPSLHLSTNGVNIQMHFPKTQTHETFNRTYLVFIAIVIHSHVFSCNTTRRRLFGDPTSGQTHCEHLTQLSHFFTSNRFTSPH